MSWPFTTSAKLAASPISTLRRVTFFMARPSRKLCWSNNDFDGCRAGDGDLTELAIRPGESQGCPAIQRFLPMRDTDAKLITLLRANAREPTASLARTLNLARSTVQERIARLEREGIIKGYTVRLSDEAEAAKLRAVVMISTDPKRADRVSIELKKMPEVRSLSAVAGT